ncbi:hypothetical protein BDV93DRAFT_122150 [Ceratobasidium sp. AG-I]|nr:hypothetical protein BDV93DRAFT_122150 [Ceratobasidium sp. AG-I]
MLERRASRLPEEGVYDLDTIPPLLQHTTTSTWYTDLRPRRFHLRPSFTTWVLYAFSLSMLPASQSQISYGEISLRAPTPSCLALPILSHLIPRSRRSIPGLCSVPVSLRVNS